MFVWSFGSYSFPESITLLPRRSFSGALQPKLLRRQVAALLALDELLKKTGGLIWQEEPTQTTRDY